MDYSYELANTGSVCSGMLLESKFGGSLFPPSESLISWFNAITFLGPACFLCIFNSKLVHLCVPLFQQLFPLAINSVTLRSHVAASKQTS